MCIIDICVLNVGQQPAVGLTTLPQAQGSLFGAAGQQPQAQPQLGFSNSAQQPSFNFSRQSSSIGAGLGSSGGLGGAASLGFPSNTGGLNFGASSNQGVGLGEGSSQAATSTQKGFQFNPNAGVSFNFGGGQSAPMAGDMLFTAGSSQSTAPSSRVIKKARRRVNK